MGAMKPPMGATKPNWKRAARIAGALAAFLAFPATAPGLDLRPVSEIRIDAIDAAPQGPGGIEVQFRALDAGGSPVRDLRSIDVSLRLDEAELPAAARGQLSATEHLPINAVIAIDTSRTMMGRPLETVRETALALVDSLGRADRVAVVTFSNAVQVLADLRTGRGDLRARLAALEIDDQALSTVVWDGVARSIELLREAGSGGPVILFSDGRDNGSGLQPPELVAAAGATEERAQVAILPVTYIGRGSQGRPDLVQLAAMTGGTLRDLDKIGASPAGLLAPQRVGYRLRFEADLDGAPHLVHLGVEGAEASRLRRFPQVVRVSTSRAGPTWLPGALQTLGPAVLLLLAGFAAGHFRTRALIGLRSLRLRLAR
ncbi:MAG: VWA domain-containing protein [bacterium]|nr:VWA domain-containing protein [bacterium]